MADGAALVSVDPLQAAALETLETCSNRWQAVDIGNLPDSSSKAQRALLQCGALSQRCGFRVIPEPTGSGYVMGVEADGNIDSAWLRDEMRRRLPDPRRISVVPLRMEIRLALEGERMRAASLAGERRLILLHVLGSGPVPGNGSKRQQPTPRVTAWSAWDCSHEMGNPGAFAAAQATASVGDIVVNNQVNVGAPAVDLT